MSRRSTPKGPLSITGTVTATLEEIVATNQTLNAFITIDVDGALAAAADADKRRDQGVSLGPFDGVVVAVKDCLDTVGLRTTRGSALYANRVPDVDAECVARLRQGGAIIIGKTNLTELACGTLGYNTYFGDVKNPRSVDHYPGGSSSGAAAALGAGLIDFAVGTDTSCSVRLPAAFCGVVGLKPTFDRISVHGNAVIARPLDHVGPMATSVAGVAELLGILQNDHWPDPAIAMYEPWNPETPIGILSGPFLETCSAEVVAAYADVLETLAANDMKLGDVTWTIDLAEADRWANLLASDMVEGFGADVDAAPGVVGEDLVYWLNRYREITPDEYAAARGAQERIRAQVLADLQRFDLVICPTVRHTAQRWVQADAWTRADRVENCSIWPLTGQPALTIPWGVDSVGMPVGLQIIGRHGEDGRVLQLGLLLERLHDAKQPVNGDEDDH